jgi:hypothetical protein
MNYSEIINAAKQYTDREDDEVDSNMDTFIAMAESRINRLLKTREQTTRAYTATVTGQEYYPLPTDYAGIRDIQINSTDIGSTSYSMSYLNPMQFNVVRNTSFCGAYYYCIIADQFQIFPILDEGQTIEIVYYQKVPALTSGSNTNWLSETSPDVYIAGIVSEIEAFVKNYEVAKAWDSKMTRCIDELDNSDVIERWSGSPLVVRLG